ncbi:MAG: AbrB/MazE/SpoVT family DNA-binding domain-containing protein [Gammaproteobacteria bacterium]|nr:AbrB/MazE/SpoVT family DNA-binding domain-containing protein [Gammaproteobacteria bacterium]
MITATITSKGQITIPKDIRLQLDLHAGDKISFIESEDGSINLVPIKKPLSALKGLVTKPKKAVSIEDMNNAVKRKAGHS